MNIFTTIDADGKVTPTITFQCSGSPLRKDEDPENRMNFINNSGPDWAREGRSRCSSDAGWVFFERTTESTHAELGALINHAQRHQDLRKPDAPDVFEIQAHAPVHLFEPDPHKPGATMTVTLPAGISWAWPVLYLPSPGGIAFYYRGIYVILNLIMSIGDRAQLHREIEARNMTLNCAG
jgi:hypothetical protein